VNIICPAQVATMVEVFYMWAKLHNQTITSVQQP